ncbi:hypothetical protein NQ317_009710 [Molorchus minor]|uniref:NADH dehydrogenase [ubiquinone] 1 alpha subcomplex subunit 8 n=1 Tax=Molorchus minor TaxID=1323400 RepID=A0ABQ9IUA2_9CUCU|nr:hypothetical protein NQ317_009710 [Molorchus minor]
MVVTHDVQLPTEEELTVEEVPLSGPTLKAGAFHLGKKCEFENNEFMLCRKELDDPRACIAEGKAITSCALNFFREVKKLALRSLCSICRKTQAVFDKCMKDNLDLERPPYDYFSRIHVHKTNRPRPEKEGPAIYPDATPGLPPDTPRPEAKYGSRYIFSW